MHVVIKDIMCHSGRDEKANPKLNPTSIFLKSNRTNLKFTLPWQDPQSGWSHCSPLRPATHTGGTPQFSLFLHRHF